MPTLATFLILASPHRAGSQDLQNQIAEGYITSLQLPKEIDVSGVRINLTPQTGYGLEKDERARIDGPLKARLQLGAYVFVLGDPNQPIKSMARVVLFRDELSRKLEGVGVIDKVIASGPEPVFRADGYLVRIAASTHLTFKDSINSLADVGTNTWIAFEGKRDADGVLVATKATFLPPKPTKFKAVEGLEVNTVKIKPAGAQGSASTQSAKGTIDAPGGGATLQEDQQLKIAPLGRWHTLPADQPLQARVERVGMALVPAYQRELHDDDPSKIHFRYFAVDYKGVRSDICLLDGVILIPTQMLERIQNDDQLAAVLADGVAYNLQRQAANTVLKFRETLLFAGAESAGSTSPGAGPLAMLAGGLLKSNSVLSGSEFVFSGTLTQMQEERARIALALMQDAGYDPRQAPEAWRLLAPGKLPKNLSKLTYPEVSGYQFNILNLQYKTGAHSGTSIGVSNENGLP